MSDDVTACPLLVVAGHRPKRPPRLCARALACARLRKSAEADCRTMGDLAIIAIERAGEAFEVTLVAKKVEKPTRQLRGRCPAGGGERGRAAPGRL